MESKEHLDIKNGKVAGLLMVDPEKARGDLWERIDQVIMAYIKVHPTEIQMLVTENKMMRETRMNKLGTSKTGLRLGVSIPPALMFKLEVVEPQLFSNKKLFNKFMRKYRGFRMCDVV